MIQLGHLIDYYERFLSRLHVDKTALKYISGAEFCCVKNLETGLSDPHSRHSTVLKVVPDKGSPFLYKPRSVAAEVAYRRFLSRLRMARICELEAPRALPRSGYGWVSNIEHAQCRNERQVSDYFFNVGQLGFVLYILGATDIHYENLIAKKNQPVVVDLETLFHVDITFATPYEDDAREKIWQKLRNTVLASGLFPNWAYPVRGGASVDVSALNGRGGQALPWTERRWSRPLFGHPNVTITPAFTSDAMNSVRLKDEFVTPETYVDRIVAGFQECYEAALHSKKLVHEAIVSSGLLHCEFRYIHRDTLVYRLLLSEAYDPAQLLNQESFLNKLGLLRRVTANSKVSTSGGSPGGTQTLIASELEDLSCGDIPVFRYDYRYGKIRDSRNKVVATAQEMPRRLNARINSLSRADLSEQVSFVRSMFSLSVDSSLAPDPLSHSTKEDARAERSAEQITEEIIRAAVFGGQNSVSWIGFELLSGHGRARLAPIGYDVYAGTLGVAVLLACSGVKEYKDGAAGVLGCIIADIDRVTREHGFHSLTTAMGAGAFTGSPGIFYCCFLLAQMLGDARLFVRAGDYAREFAASVAQLREDQLDLMTGLSGGLLALVRAHQVTGYLDLLEAASDLGHGIVKRLRSGELGSASNNFGCAHGKLGILLALAALYRQTGEKELLIEVKKLVAECIESAARISNASWCNGYSGFVQVFSMIWKETPELRSLMPTPSAVASTLIKMPVETVDNVCCGEFGRVSALLSLDSVLESQNCTEYAKKFVRMCNKELRGGRFRTNLLAGGLNPGFFQGEAGVAYSLFRLENLELPCIEVLGLHKNLELSVVEAIGRS